MEYYVLNTSRVRTKTIAFVHANLNTTRTNFPYSSDGSVCDKNSIFLYIKNMPDATLGDGCWPNWFIGLHLNDGKLLAIPYGSVKLLE